MRFFYWLFKGCNCRRFNLGVEYPKREWNLKTKDDPDDTKKIKRDGYYHRYIEIDGPGTFLSAYISKLSTSEGIADLSKITVARLRLDGKRIFQQSFKRTRIMGFLQNNPYGVALLDGSEVVIGGVPHFAETLTFGFTEPLYFVDKLHIEIWISDEAVERIFTSIISSHASPIVIGDDSEGSSSGGDPMFPPD